MWGVNKATLLGNVSEPEVRYGQDGKAVVRLRLATTRSAKNAAGESSEVTQWHSVVLFGRLAEFGAEYVHKGAQVYVEGEIRYRKVAGNDGVERYYTDIVASELRLLGQARTREPASAGTNNAQTQANPTPSSFNRMETNRSAPTARPRTPTATASPSSQAVLEDDPFLSDIPF